MPGQMRFLAKSKIAVTRNKSADYISIKIEGYQTGT